MYDAGKLLIYDAKQKNLGCKAKQLKVLISTKAKKYVNESVNKSYDIKNLGRKTFYFKNTKIYRVFLKPREALSLLALFSYTAT